jgi:sn-glycerol 3-phosphate transport system substrate-binding protein
VQSASHKRTGYLPVTTAAFELTEKSGFYKENPGTDVAVTQMIRKVTDKSRGIRLGNYVQIRTIEDEELEQVWAARRAPRKRSTRSSSAATSSWSASRRANKGGGARGAWPSKSASLPLGWLPWALLAPQVVVIALFFFWPARRR